MFASGLKVFGLEQMVVRSTQSEVSENHQTFLWMLRHLLALNLPAHVMYEGIEHPLISPELWRWIPYQSQWYPFGFFWKSPNHEAWCLGLNFQFPLLLQTTVLDLCPIYDDINIKNKRTSCTLSIFISSEYLINAKHKMWVILLRNIIGIERSRYFNTKNDIAGNFGTNVYTFIMVL